MKIKTTRDWREIMKGVSLAIVIVPLALPAFFIAWVVSVLSFNTIDLSSRLVVLINKIP